MRREAAARTAPVTSKPLCFRPFAGCGMIKDPAIKVMMPRGTLTKKTQRHERN
jgi:hypothetical protein